MSDKTEQEAKVFEEAICALEVVVEELTAATGEPLPKTQEVIARAKRALAEMRGGS